MLKINSPLFKLITILFRQMYLSIARYSTEEDFYDYFADKHKFYKYAIIELEKILSSYHDYYSFPKMLKNIFFTKKLRFVEILLVYKILKEFDEMLDSKDFYNMIYEKKTHISSREVYSELLRMGISKRERKIIDETEHFGQNFILDHYKSIEENLSRLNIKIEIN